MDESPNHLFFSGSGYNYIMMDMQTQFLNADEPPTTDFQVTFKTTKFIFIKFTVLRPKALVDALGDAEGNLGLVVIDPDCPEEVSLDAIICGRGVSLEGGRNLEELRPQKSLFLLHFMPLSGQKNEDKHDFLAGAGVLCCRVNPRPSTFGCNYYFK